MESGMLHLAAASAPARGPSRRSAKTARGRDRKLRLRATLVERVLDEPIAVVAAGATPSALIGTLLGNPGPLLDLWPGSYLVVTHGRERHAAAYVPGSRQPHPCPELPAGDQRVTGRPPRRVELTLPDPLLRHFALVGAPHTATLGVAGTRVLLDAVEHGGALLFTQAADQPLGPIELDLLAEVARRNVPVFLVLMPGAAGGWPVRGEVSSSCGPVPALINAHRVALAAAVPALADAPWFAVDPPGTDPADLRRALIEWAEVTGLRRAGEHRPVPVRARTVRVAADAYESNWPGRLERMVRSSAQLVRQRLAIELANIHLRCVQELVFGSGCAGLPDSLDREVHALSLRAVAECDDAVTRILDQALTQVLGEAPDEGVRRRVAAAVRRGFAEDPAAGDLDRVLLITSTGGVASVVGPEAVAALAAYHTDAAPSVLPPLGVGLSGGCYAHWRNPSNSDVNGARSWLHRATRAVELDLLREVSRRFEAVQRSLNAVLGEAVDHGILLA